MKSLVQTKKTVLLAATMVALVLGSACKKDDKNDGPGPDKKDAMTTEAFTTALKAGEKFTAKFTGDDATTTTAVDAANYVEELTFTGTEALAIKYVGTAAHGITPGDRTAGKFVVAGKATDADGKGFTLTLTAGAGTDAAKEPAITDFVYTVESIKGGVLVVKVKGAHLFAGKFVKFEGTKSAEGGDKHVAPVACPTCTVEAASDDELVTALIAGGKTWTLEMASTDATAANLASVKACDATATDCQAETFKFSGPAASFKVTATSKAKGTDPGTADAAGTIAKNTMSTFKAFTIASLTTVVALNVEHSAVKFDSKTAPTTMQLVRGTKLLQYKAN